MESRCTDVKLILNAAEGCAGHDSLAPLAYSPGKTYSAFANGTDENTLLPQTKKAAKQTRRVLRPSQKAAKGGKGEGEGKESPERKTVGRGKGGKCRLLYQFCLFSLPSLSRRLSSLGLPQRDAGSRRLRWTRFACYARLLCTSDLICFRIQSR